jgi:two-component sensor histidine kinase
MDIFAIFSIICFVIYFQAGIFVLWKNPFMGINYLFSIMSFSFAVLSLAYVFSYMGDAARNIFPPALITLNVIVLAPAFYMRVGMSLINYPRKQSIRNVIFAFILLLVGITLFFLIKNEAFTSSNRISVMNHTWFLMSVNFLLLLTNTYLFSRLQFYILKPDIVSKEIVQEMGFLYILCDEQYFIRDINNYTARLSGYNKSLIIGQHLNEFVLLNDLDSRLTETVENGFTCPFDAILQSNSDETIHVLLECCLLKDNFNDTHGIVLTGEDTSYAVRMINDIQRYDNTRMELKEASEELQKMIKACTLGLAEIYDQLSIIYKSKNHERILAEFHERDYLIGEIHERVIVNMKLALLIINIHHKNHDDAFFKTKLKILSQRVRSILLAYEHLYFSINYSEVDFKGLIYRLVTELKSIYDKENKVGISFNICDRYLDVEKAMVLAVVTNELITNCFTNAFQTSEKDAMIKIDFKEHSGFFRLIIRDNGNGFPEGFNFETIQSSGLKLAEILVKDQVNGEIDFCVSSGSTVTITIPMLN